MVPFKTFPFLTLLFFVIVLQLALSDAPEQEINEVAKIGETVEGLSLLRVGEGAPESPEDCVENNENEDPFKFTMIPSYLRRPFKEKSGNYYDEMPLVYTRLFETTLYIEIFLFCFIIAYGILHLPCWERLYNLCKAFGEQTKDEGEEEEEEEVTEQVKETVLDTESD